MVTLNRNQVLIMITLISLAGYFYWSEVRPTQINKACSDEAWQKTKGAVYRYDDYKVYFAMCQHAKGL